MNDARSNKLVANLDAHTMTYNLKGAVTGRQCFVSYVILAIIINCFIQKCGTRIVDHNESWNRHVCMLSFSSWVFIRLPIAFENYMCRQIST